MDPTQNYIRIFNEALRRLFLDAFWLSLSSPLRAYAFLRTVFMQNKAGSLRQKWVKKGLPVPAIMITSITAQCNLHCTGCYSRVHTGNQKKELTVDEWRGVFSQARDLGISIVLLAGGEPFMRKDVIRLAGEFPEIIFSIFTNGLLMDDESITWISRIRNVVPVISLEGYEKSTDERRGKGTYGRLLRAMDRLSKKNVFFGASITATRKNLGIITQDGFIRDLLKTGAKIIFFIEYTPVEKSTRNLVLTLKERDVLTRAVDGFNSRFRAIFEAFPGNEERYGGCLAAGRGFIHVSSSGFLEPCPFAPYSDTDLKKVSLQQALQSSFLKTIRENHSRLTETRGGCALWTNRDWVSSVLRAGHAEARRT
ncbi:MAG: radical SAM protein [bacterium]|nr:radical SAM protein [bacterium]